MSVVPGKSGQKYIETTHEKTKNLMINLTMPVMENLMKLLIMMGLMETARLVMKTNLKMVELVQVPTMKAQRKIK